MLGRVRPPGRFVALFHEDVEVRTSATAPAVPCVPTNVRCAGSVPLYLQVFWLPVRQLVPPGYWCVVLVSSQLTATVTSLAPGLAVRTFDGTSHSPYPFEPFSDPERVAAAPLTVTLKLAGTSLFPWSRPPQLTQTRRRSGSP